MARELLVSSLDRMLHMGLDRLIQRQAVLAANVANADTPGYRARDLSFEGELRAASESAASKVDLARTHEAHLALQESEGSGQLVVSEAQAGVDGNNVNLDREMVRSTENALRYQALSSALGRRISILRTAVTEGGAR